MHLTQLNRFKAAGIHFGISLAIFIALVIMVFTVWYPGILSKVDTGWHRALLLIAGVDLVLGPLLTLIVFNPAKKSLRFDLAVIAIAQLSALVAGLYTVHTTRPLALYTALPAAGFDTLYAHQVNPETRAFLSHSDNKLFYYAPDNNFTPFGAASLEQITPADLHSTTAAEFAAFMKQSTPDGLLEKDGAYTIPQGQSGKNLVLLEKNGQLREIQIATGD
ncbi:hypothetical protein [Parathalassolituus penaei]|uniref:Pilus assembly protein n=1 Tax=Parathalassolituus penaei TaxID=2997323 RepID=A0A9X3EB44_9GAMM|nr:hypothetical protein [Parathalassolituus penaei]MCY0964287.1 hypothetical protein [Parathalassolituus penaei]